MHARRKKGDPWKVILVYIKVLEVALVGAMVTTILTSTQIWIGY